MRDAIQEFMDFNRPFARRNPELIRFKIARMAEGPLAFLRGTFHLFARDVLEKAHDPLPLFTGEGPELDIVGDIHSENYGSFKADDNAVHYDVNDFDETTTGRFDFDVCRAAVSWHLAARERGDTLAEAVQASLAAVGAYADSLTHLIRKGRAPDFDVSESHPAGCGPVDELVHAAAAAKRTAFIERLTEQADKGRRLLRSPRYFNLPDDERALAERLLADYLRRRSAPGDTDYYRVEDVCGRVSGIGSMGRLRYVLLLSGKGSADGRNVLLEFKEGRPSAYDICRKRAADVLGRAERVITAARASMAASSGHLGFAVDQGMSFQAREIGPADARVDTRSLKSPALLADALRVQAQILVRIHARAALRAVGPANPLAELVDPDAFCQRVLCFTLGYADIVRRDWLRFVGARGDLENVSAWAGND
ncbi:MAG TPA: DUF2252 family protein [Gemmataceae bacterium]|nr:DUF2252 family protein [Gemmataceae bacterium]